jgi:hypothetical protein
MARKVVASAAAMRGSASGARRSRNRGAGVPVNPGTRRRTPSAAATASAATYQSALRQSATLPITVPIGAPSAVAPLSPARTTARARPRRSGVTSIAAVALAAGVNIAAPSPATARPASARENAAAAAVSRLPAMNTARPESRTCRRGQRVVSAAATGVSSA